MKIAVKKLSELLQGSVEVPVFEYTLPGEFVGTGIVVSEKSYDDELDEAEYTVSIYAPDQPAGSPDMELIEALVDQILPLLEDLWDSEFNGWIHKRELFKEGAMHYLTLSLTLQFN